MIKILKYFPLVGLIGAHLFLLFNLQFTAWPEMSSFPYLFSNGFTIYKDFVHPYPPLLTLILSGVYYFFGYNLLTLKIFTWTLIIINDIFLFAIVKTLTKNNAIAFLSIIFYILTQPFLDGNMLWFDTAIVTPILIAMYFTVQYIEGVGNQSKNLLMSGFFLGIGLITKQTVLAFVGVQVLLILLYQKRKRDVFIFLAPILATLGMVVVWLSQSNSLSYFLNWNFVYPANYWTNFPGYVILSPTNRELLVLLMLILPSFFLLLSKFKVIVARKSYLLTYLFFVAGIVAVYPRFSFFHFQAALAFCTILFGIWVSYLKTKWKFILPYLIVIFMVVSLPILKVNWQKEARFWSNSDYEFSDIISHKVGDKSVFLLGLHSGNYILSGTLPPKPWLDNFGWFFEVPGVQEETIKLWEESLPSAIFIKDREPGNWYEIGTYQPKQILSWIETNYTKKEEVVPGVWYWELKNK